MDRFPVLRDGQAVGELRIEKEPDCTAFQIRCRGEGLYTAWVVGTGGELRLGIPETENGILTLSRRFSSALTSPVGTLIRGELRAFGGMEEENWRSAGSPEMLVRSEFLRARLRGVSGALTRYSGGLRFLALPFDKHRPFPLTALFCFARVMRIDGTVCAVFAFDRNENPVFH